MNGHPLLAAADLTDLYGLLICAGVLLAIVGSVMGYCGKLVVYENQADLNVTCASLIFAIGTGAAACYRAEVPWLFWVAVVVTSAFLGSSIKRSCRANRAIARAVLAVFAKYALLGLIVVCALFAVAGALVAADEARKKRYREAAEAAAVGAAGTLGFASVRRLIERLVDRK